MRLGKDVLDRDLYEALGVPFGASQDEIRSAYRRQARQSHPDLNHCDPAAGARMAAVNIAARVLLDPALRRAYDQARTTRAARPVSEAAAAASAAPSSAWYEQDSSGDDADWVAPAPAPSRPLCATGAVARFLDEIRTRDGKLSLHLDELVRGMPSHKQITIAAVCLTAAIALLISVYPTRSFPTVNPTALYP